MVMLCSMTKSLIVSTQIAETQRQGSGIPSIMTVAVDQKYLIQAFVNERLHWDPTCGQQNTMRHTPAWQGQCQGTNH